MKLKKTYTSGNLVNRLRKRYDDKQRHSLFEQVANGTGYRCRSWVDVVVVDLWPSDGFTKRAFEIKISRADFLNELKNPKKNAWAREYCNEFWYVAPSNVVKEEELPEGAGWMCPRGEEQLMVKRHAARKAEPTLDNMFVASLARSMQKERGKAVQEAAARVLQESPLHLGAVAGMRAVERFLKEHGRSTWPNQNHKDFENNVYSELHKATADNGVEKQRAHIVRWLDTFQQHLFGMYDVMTVLTCANLLETDELGNFLYRDWDINSSAILSKEKMLKKKGGKRLNRRLEDQHESFEKIRERVTSLLAGYEDTRSYPRRKR